MSQRFINYYQHKIAYSIKGSGTPLVLIHGFGEDSRIWEDFLPTFKDFKVVTIDLPGSGDSEVMENMSIARMAKVIHAVLKAEEIAKCIMIGHSMGGYVTIAFAKLYPSKLLGFGLFHSHPYADSAEKKAGRKKGIDFIKNNGVKPFFRGLTPQLFAPEFVKTNKPIIDKTIDRANQLPEKGIIAQLKAMRNRPDNTSVLKNAQVPVLFIIGKKDRAVPEESSLNQTFLPDIADIHILPEVGHMGMLEAKEKTRKIINDFILFCTTTHPMPSAYHPTPNPQ